MKQVGEMFLEKRNEIGISIKEVSKDLNIDEVLIENLESGNVKAFKDILELKEVAIALSKYLGLDEEEIIDEINDYIFEKTSKISIEDIKNAQEELSNKDKIRSPYTIEKEVNNKKIIGWSIFGILLFFIVLYFLLRYIFIG